MWNTIAWLGVLTAIIFLVDTMGICSSVDADVYNAGIFAERQRCKEIIKNFICELIDLL